MGKLLALGLVKVADRRAAGKYDRRLSLHSQGGQIRHLVLGKELSLHLSHIQIRLVHYGDDHSFGLAELLKMVSILRSKRRIQPRIGKDLTGRELFDLVQCAAKSIYLCRIEISGGNIGEGQREYAACRHRCAEIIITILRQHCCVNVGARCHDPHHIPFDDALCCLGILQLFADRHLVACLHQPSQIGIYGVKRHAAHGRPLLQATVLPGQNNIQFLGDDLRVFKEHLIKIAEAIKQYAPRILSLRLDIQFHHRRQSADVDLIYQHELNSLSHVIKSPGFIQPDIDDPAGQSFVAGKMNYEIVRSTACHIAFLLTVALLHKNGHHLSLKT